MLRIKRSSSFLFGRNSKRPLNLGEIARVNPQCFGIGVKTWAKLREGEIPGGDCSPKLIFSCLDLIYERLIQFLKSCWS